MKSELCVLSMVASSLVMTGCYKPAGDEADALDFADDMTDVLQVDAAVRPDTSAPQAASCSGADPIATLFCNLAQPVATEQNSPVAELTRMLNGVGGLANLAQVVGPLLGTSQTPGQGSQLLNLIELGGGLANIAQLLNGVSGVLNGQQTATQPSLADLLAAFTGQGQAQQPQAPSLADLLQGFGLPVAQQAPVVTQEPTADECAQASSPALRFVCMLQQANTAR